jgi:hypothetical protein
MRFDKHLLLAFCLLCGGFSTVFAQTCPRANPVVVNTTANTGQTLSWAVGCINSNTALTQINVNVGSGIIRVTANLPIAPIRRSNAVINGNGAVIDGSQVTTGNGLQIDAQNVSINSFTIQNFRSAAGIRINTGNDASITGNTLINNLYGVFVARSVANGDIINNDIGVNGTTSAGNSGAGVFFEALVSNPTTPPNVSNNTIANNGVGIDANNTRNVLISTNTMFCNITSGINRATNIVAPVITSAGTTVVRGTATPGALVEVYAVDNGNCIRVACQGRTYLGKAVTATNGQWALFTTGLKVGQNATATQTLSSVNTSEFANCVAAVNLCANINAAIIKTDVLCNGGATGAATILVSGASSPLRLAWSNGATTASIANLRIGDYDVSITDGNNCTANPSTTINEPPVLGLSLQAKDETYVGKGDGSVSSNVAGGVAPYAYLWNTGAATPAISNLKPGTYSLTITDDKKCTTKQTVTVKGVDCSGFSASSTVKKKACNGIADGQATVNATNGVEPYLFQWGNQRNGVSFTDLAAGTYTLTATDARGCVAKTTVLIPEATALGVKINAKNPLCFGDSTGLAIALVSGGDKPYQYLWSNGSKNDTLFKLPIGTYRVVVTDSSSCSTSLSATLTQPKALSLTIKTTNETQVGKGDGTATPTVTGGVPPYKYKWSNDTVIPNLTGLKTGAYTLIVTDSNRCAISQTIRISSINCDGFIASTVLNKRACTGVSDGQATVSATGGVAPYVFQWSNQRSGDGFKDLAAGSYAITATDSRGCVATTSITVPLASSLKLQLNVTNPACFGENTGQATGLASGGNTPYLYAWSSGATVAAISQLSIGTYTLVVTDSNACQIKQSVTLVQPIALTLSLTGANETQVGKGDGTVTSTLGGGTTPYQYRWSNNATTANLANLKPGTYSLTVTDANRCSILQTVTIGSVNCNGMTANAVMNKRVCSGLTDGQATASASGGVAPYVFQWSNQRSGAGFKDLAAGLYSVTATDSRGCTATATVTIPTATALNLQMTGSNPACFGAKTGQALGVVSGGNAPYRYLWSTNATTNSITQLGIGTYTLAVTDSNACEVKNSVTISQPTAIGIILTGTGETQLGKGDGIASSTVSGGVPPYLYRWSNNTTLANAAGLKPGTYSLTVTDANQCTGVQTVVIGSVNCTGFSAAAVVNKRVCSGLNDGQATVNATGGVAPFVFQWSNQRSGASFKDLAAGNYTITASDSKGCTASISIVVPSAKNLTLQLTTTNPLCFGGTTGQIVGVAGGGNAPYQYSWNNGATTASIAQLPIGTYTLAVTDSNACIIKQTATLTQPTAINLVLNGTNETQLGKGDGTATSAVSGGVSPYQYLWSNGATTANLANLKTGTYSLTVTDANRCTAVQSVIIAGANCTGFSASAVLNKRVCSGLSDGQATVNATGGVAPFVFQWSNQRSGTSFKDLVAGDYTITVSDSKGCTTVVNIKVPLARVLSVQLAGVNPSCFGTNSGQVSANVSGGNAPYQFVWSNGATTTSISQLPGGVYNLAVTDSNRCVVNGSVTLTQPSELKISFTAANESQPGKKDGTITSAITGGVSPFQVVWSNGATGANINNLAAGTYSVTVTDAKGCQVKGSTTLGGAACSGFAVSATATKGSCSGANDGKAEANSTGGVAPFVFQWSNGKTGSKQDNLKPGIYQVTATDGKGCVAGASVTIVASLRTPRPAYGLIAPDSVCSKSTLTLSVDDLWPNPTNVRYIWELPTGDSVITSTRELRIPNASAKNAGDYFVARDSAGCVSPAFGPVIVTVLGVSNGAGIAGRDTTLCTNNGTINLKASLPSKSKGFWIALDGGSISNPTALNPTVGNFKTGANRFVWSLDLGKCAALFADTVTVFLEQKPVLEDDYFQIAKVQDIAAMNVLLNDNIEGVQEIKLSILNPPLIGKLEFVPSTKSYRYTAPDEFRGAVEFKYIVCNAKAKCATACDTAGVLVDVFNLPTPTDGLIIEDPGLNGQLIIHGLPGFTQVGIDIFNRWGDLVYRNADYDNGTPWKGTQGNNGKFLPPGAYYYVLKAFDGDKQVGKPQTGVIHLFTKKEN